MKWIGPELERRRLALGLSRAELARRVGVSAQTVLNVERQPTYNLSVRLLKSLSATLQLQFEIIIKEKTMTSDITMGNDEFILYIRKNFPECTVTNDQLGKRVWMWLRDQAAAKAGSGDAVACLWGESATNLGELALPSTATQFSFDRKLLPALYDLLDSLGQQ
jgi:transcriptional regulator with XRE-family HTH domain